MSLTLLTASIAIDKFVKIVADLAVKIQSAFDQEIAENPKPIEVLPKRTRTIELSNGVYQTTRQSYKFYVPEELGVECSKVLNRLQEEGRKRKAEGIDQLNQQLRFVHNGMKFIVIGAGNWFDKGWSLIFTLDNSEITSSRAVDVNSFDNVVAKDKEATHVTPLNTQVSADDLAKIEKSKVNMDEF